MSGNGLAIEQARAFIDSADLSFIVDRLMQVNGWTRKSSLAALQQYRHYLYLKKKFGNQYLLPPSYEIDEVWHTHILHTREYAEFCHQFFGNFFHHEPQAVTTPQSVSVMEQEFMKTQELYRHEFGDYIYAIKQAPIQKFLLSLFRKLVVRLKLLFQSDDKTMVELT